MICLFKIKLTLNISKIGYVVCYLVKYTIFYEVSKKVV